ncbi:MAG TPA: arylsulfatase [Rhodospirillaceae bacterium]|nr:arylsulfatase [Rhodospirillaceae bacterium]HAT35319.1 arylsulfatase [Rhodospirillaceae bacterium]
MLPAIGAVEAMFEKHWPDAERASLYDQSLYLDLNPDRSMPPAVVERVGDLVGHCVKAGADAILCTGSLFGPAIEAARENLDMPVLTSFEALIETAFETGNRFALVATDPGTNKMLGQDLQRHADAHGQSLETETIFVDEAMKLLSAGDQAGHDDLVVDAAAGAGRCDAMLLGQFSMGPTKPLVEARTGLPVLDAPETAVLKLKSLLEG